jgi:hypothetical protein
MSCSEVKFPKETRDQEKIKDYYGDPGEVELVRLFLPYPMRLSWNMNIIMKSFYCHKKVAASLFNILSATLAYYGLEEIKDMGLDILGGCYNVRRKRGSDNEWSTHSYGIAVDMGPDCSRDKFRWGADQVRSSQPEYEMFWQFVEHEGWKSLGRSKNFDWMHIQATS